MQIPELGKIDQKAGRAINRKLILNLVRTGEGLSRRELADLTGLSTAAVSFVVNDLLAEGYLIEGKPAGRGAGRKRVPLGLNDHSNYAIGLRLSVDRLDCILTDLSMRLIDSHHISLNAKAPDDVVIAARRGVETLLKRKSGDARIIGVGFTSPGRFDPHTGMCLRNNRFGWHNVPIGPMLSEALGFPVYTENDTMAFGLAHHLFGLGQSYKRFAVVAVGEGIGCALISGGAVYRGANGNAGKVGHVLHGDPNTGPLCDCGRRGCLQAYFAVPAMIKTWSEQHGGDGDLVTALQRNDPEAVAEAMEAGQQIGRHLAEWVTVLDPEIIILGGESVEFGPPFLTALQHRLDADYYCDPAPQIISDTTDFYWTAGAAAVAIQQIFGS